MWKELLRFTDNFTLHYDKKKTRKCKQGLKNKTENGKSRAKSAAFLTSAFSNSPKSNLDALWNEKQKYQCACVWQSYLCGSSSIKHKAACLMDQRQQTAVQVNKKKRWSKYLLTQRECIEIMDQPLLPRTCSYLILQMMCVRYKHVSVRTRSLACRIIEYALPVCNVKGNILTASLLLSHGFKMNFK